MPFFRTFEKWLNLCKANISRETIWVQWAFWENDLISFVFIDSHHGVKMISATNMLTLDQRRLEYANRPYYNYIYIFLALWLDCFYMVNIFQM